ncbi:MAG TPA: hypothetical protein VHC21_02825 [Candidatus Saccharimonadales bacterium]|nr:hypothetical protein [Candidatus Saccharimonadales bacterium]
MQDPWAEYLIRILKEDPSLPRPDYVYGAGVEWITEAEARRREEAARHMPSLEELLEDPNVRVVVEAAEGLIPVPES